MRTKTFAQSLSSGMWRAMVLPSAKVVQSGAKALQEIKTMQPGVYEGMPQLQCAWD